jgi:hypothetical protein
MLLVVHFLIRGSLPSRGGHIFGGADDPPYQVVAPQDQLKSLPTAYHYQDMTAVSIGPLTADVAHVKPGFFPGETARSNSAIGLKMGVHSRRFINKSHDVSSK